MLKPCHGASGKQCANDIAETRGDGDVLLSKRGSAGRHRSLYPMLVLESLDYQSLSTCSARAVSSLVIRYNIYTEYCTNNTSAGDFTATEISIRLKGGQCQVHGPYSTFTASGCWPTKLESFDTVKALHNVEGRMWSAPDT